MSGAGFLIRSSGGYVVRVVSAQIPENGDVTKGGSAGTGTRGANGYAVIYLEPGRWILGEVGRGRARHTHSS